MSESSPEGGWGGRSVRYESFATVGEIRVYGKIALHLLFGWSLDKDKKSLDQSKQFS